MSETNVVTASEIAEAPVEQRAPRAFRDLNKSQLVEAALYFGADETGTAAEIRAELTDTGVTWDQYEKAFGLNGKSLDDEEEFSFPEPLVEFDENEEEEEVTDIVTKAAVPTLAPADKYLIKFVGQNPYFEFGPYKFTQERPYGIMPAVDAQNALVGEPDKFRQAYPAELQEYYS